MDTRKIEERLAAEHHYKNLPGPLSKKYRDLYTVNTPVFLTKTTNQPLYTANGTMICSAFDRVVIGDYGAFVEFSQEQANKDRFVIAPGQEYRVFDPRYYDTVKYAWLTIKDGSNVKIYQQKRSVSYADYVPGKYYVSVHEVKEYDS